MNQQNFIPFSGFISRIAWDLLFFYLPASFSVLNGSGWSFWFLIALKSLPSSSERFILLLVQLMGRFLITIVTLPLGLRSIRVCHFQICHFDMWTILSWRQLRINWIRKKPSRNFPYLTKGRNFWEMRTAINLLSVGILWSGRRWQVSTNSLHK